jgi:four helix bundle protein
MTCGTQLVRSLDSVGANIAESTGRWHPREKRQFYVIARGSLLEAEHWLERAHTRGLLEQPMSERLDEVARVLNGLVKRSTPTSR